MKQERQSLDFIPANFMIQEYHGFYVVKCQLQKKFLRQIQILLHRANKLRTPAFRCPLAHRHAHRRTVQRMASLPVHAVDQLHALAAMFHYLGFRDSSPHRVIPPLFFISQAVNDRTLNRTAAAAVTAGRAVGRCAGHVAHALRLAAQRRI